MAGTALSAYPSIRGTAKSLPYQDMHTKRPRHIAKPSSLVLDKWNVGGIPDSEEQMTESLLFYMSIKHQDSSIAQVRKKVIELI